MTVRKNLTVESFDRRLLALLLKGARETTEVPGPPAKLVALRQRLYLLRKAMNQERHPLSSEVNKIKILLSWERRKEKPSLLGNERLIITNGDEFEFGPLLNDLDLDLPPEQGGRVVEEIPIPEIDVENLFADFDKGEGET